jgi:hypothetical protein
MEDIPGGQKNDSYGFKILFHTAQKFDAFKFVQLLDQRHIQAGAFERVPYRFSKSCDSEALRLLKPTYLKLQSALCM